MKEREIRDQIVTSCERKLPNLKPFDFTFVKRERGKIYTPTFGSDFQFDYCQIIKLCGQGKLYIRLNKNPTVSHSDESSSD